MSKEHQYLRNSIISAIDSYELEIWATAQNYEHKLAAIRSDINDILSDNELSREKLEGLLNAIQGGVDEMNKQKVSNTYYTRKL